jgi:Flp pilus assembly protein TadD
MGLEDKDYKSAARWAREALQINVMDAEVHWMLARAHVQTGQADKARAVIEDLLKLDADHEEAKQLLENLRP